MDNIIQKIVQEVDDSCERYEPERDKRLRSLLKELEDPWIPIKKGHPRRSPIVWMYKASNNEFFVSHFTYECTHWQPLIKPTDK